jgi:hypothetical protein
MVVTIAPVTVGQWAWLLSADSRRLICRTCPANLLEVAREDTSAKLLYSLRGSASSQWRWPELACWPGFPGSSPCGLASE